MAMSFGAHNDHFQFHFWQVPGGVDGYRNMSLSPRIALRFANFPAFDNTNAGAHFPFC